MAVLWRLVRRGQTAVPETQQVGLRQTKTIAVQAVMQKLRRDKCPIRPDKPKRPAIQKVRSPLIGPSPKRKQAV